MYMQYNHETRKLNTSMLANMNSQAVPQIRFNTGRRGTIACKPISSEKNNNYKKNSYYYTRSEKTLVTQLVIAFYNFTQHAIVLSHNTRMSYQKFIKFAVARSRFWCAREKKCNNTTSWQSRHILYQGRIY